MISRKEYTKFVVPPSGGMTPPEGGTTNFNPVCFLLEIAELNNRQTHLEGDLSELLQHEYDHLDGILAVSRAVDGRSFALRSQSHLFI
ncbi:peptide deformylase [Desulfococcaceae bacterium HSG8]|nr:peptide deformylase [Desulfococcaceae bacterium HSG8]